MKQAIIILLLGITSVCSSSNYSGYAKSQQHPVFVQLSPNHASGLWARHANASVKCPQGVRASLQMHGRQVALNLQLNDQGQHQVPIIVDDGHKAAAQSMPASGCFYRDEETFADVLLRPQSEGMQVSGRFMTPEGVYVLETNKNLQHSVYQLGTEKAVESLKSAKEKRDLTKRASTKYVEVMPVFDYNFYQLHLKLSDNNEQKAIEEIKYYCIQLLAEINYIYTNSKSGIVIAPSGCYITKTKGGNKCVDENLRGEFNDKTDREGLNAKGTLTTCGIYADEHLPKADHYMYIVLLDLYSENYGLKGMAWIAKACDKKQRISVVQDHGIHFSAFVGAHELGHNLGAEHDGPDVHTECKNKDQHVMSTTIDPTTDNYAKNSMIFSKCSIADMTKYLSKVKCVNNKPDLTKYSKYEKPLLSSKLSLDQQCEMTIGLAGSKYCGGQLNLKNVCVNLLCTDPATGECVGEAMAYEGTSCGDKKLCRHNNCVKDSSAPSVKKCQYGDWGGRMGFSTSNGEVRYTCAEAAKNRKGFCYRYAEECCETCSELTKGRPETCPFGDTKPSCANIKDAYLCYNPANVKECCETCGKFNTGDPSCKYGDNAASGDTRCSKMFPGSCNDDVEAKQCCQSCKKLRTNDPTCPFGDWANNCKNLHSFDCAKPERKTKCCETCKQFKTNDPNCPNGDEDEYCRMKDSGECNDPAIAKKCCATCKKFKTDDATCPYGNTGSNCDSMRPSKCSKAHVAKECCGTCNKLRTNDPDCPFGDDADTCATQSLGKCYRKSNQRKCCGTCKKNKSSDPSCPYGDRVNCAGLAVRRCTAGDLGQDCCATCKKLKG